jgi:CubicO group peptidase (beta-lactamase class C family)
LEGFDVAGRPRFRAASRPPTIRELLCHTSGYAYGMWNENLRRFDPAVPRQYRDDFIRLPLASDPGTRWEYSPGAAFLGLVIEKVSGLTLEAYFQRHIFGPLRMHDTFYQVPADRWPRVVSRHHRRAGDGAVIAQPKEAAPPRLTFFPGDGTLHSTGPDYLRFVRAFLNGGELDGERIAKPETIEMMCRNQIGDFRAGEMPSAMPALSHDVHLFPGATNKFGFGFLIHARPVPGGRSAGSLMWGGLHNTYFWIDREQGVGGVVLTQVLPFADPVVLDLVTDYERAIYALPR